jgi:hypothetical protein
MSKRAAHRPEAEGPAAEPKHEGKGGSRQGYRSSNEIEDMEIFDDEPGKEPSEDGRHDAKSIDENGYRERK